MSRRELLNKPLVEAIFELRWELKEKSPGFAYDPHYHLLLGRFYDRIQAKYPVHEQLETANIPDEMLGPVVQHRFRESQDGWPLVQIGPGIFTLNDTQKYKWEDFRPRVLEAGSKLFAAYPSPDEFRVKDMTLRYIDAVEIDYKSESIFSFLKDKLKVAISLPQNLFEETGIDPLPQNFQSNQRYRSNEPLGVVQLKFATGQRSDKPALIWETIFRSSGDDLPQLPEKFATWLDQSHNLINDWFFKMIEGDLHKRFSGE